MKVTGIALQVLGWPLIALAVLAFIGGVASYVRGDEVDFVASLAVTGLFGVIGAGLAFGGRRIANAARKEPPAASSVSASPPSTSSEQTEVAHRQPSWWWVLGIVAGGVVLVLAGVGGFLALRNSDALRQDAEQEPDRVVSVAYRCSYQVQERGADGRLATVTRDGEGDYCTPARPHRVGTVFVSSVSNRRSILSVRTPQGGSYTVETSTNVKVGDSWPHPSEGPRAQSQPSPVPTERPRPTTPPPAQTTPPARTASPIPSRPPTPSSPPTAAAHSLVETVRAYYLLLTQRNFALAWPMLSSEYQAQYPYERWVADFDQFPSLVLTAAEPGTSANEVAAHVLALVRTQSGLETWRWITDFKLVQESGEWKIDKAIRRPVEVVTPTSGPSLAVGYAAQVWNLGGAACANLRESPTLGARSLACLPEGTVLKLHEAPVMRDGYRWWRVQQWDGAPPAQPVLVGPAGWMAESYLAPYEY